MKVILKESVSGLGTIGDEVEVKPGHARNFLIPRKKALAITDGNARQLGFQRKLIERKRTETIEASKSLAEKLADLHLVFRVKAGEKGKLFGSITSKKIQDELEARGVEIQRGVFAGSAGLRELGEHTVPLRLDGGIKAELKVTLEREEAEDEAKNESREGHPETSDRTSEGNGASRGS